MLGLGLMNQHTGECGTSAFLDIMLLTECLAQEEGIT